MLHTFSLALGLVVLITPCSVLAQYTSGVEHVGERSVSFLASPFFAAFDPTTQRGQSVTTRSPTTPSPGMCRWERLILTPNGSPVLDQSGQPLREYMIAPCDRPPH